MLASHIGARLQERSEDLYMCVCLFLCVCVMKGQQEGMMG